MNRFLSSTNYLKDGFAAPGSIQPRSDNGGSNVAVSCGITEVILKYFLKFVYFWKKWPIKPISGIKCHWWLLLIIFLIISMIFAKTYLCATNSRKSKIRLLTSILAVNKTLLRKCKSSTEARKTIWYMSVRNKCWWISD